MVVQNIYSKMHPSHVLIPTHNDVTDLVNHGTKNLNILRTEHNSASKAKNWQWSGKKLIYQNQSSIKNGQCLVSFFLYINIFANTCMKNDQFEFFYQYMLSLTKVKQFSKSSKNLFLKYPYPQLLRTTFILISCQTEVKLT